jgi:galactose mutarotase-like enzyme
MIGDSLFRMQQHGFLRNVCWNIENTYGDSEIRLNLENPGLVSEGYGYPFKSSFSQYFGLSENGSLLQFLLFKNLSEATAPVDLGIHAYFPFVQGMTIPEMSGLNYENETDWNTRSNNNILKDPAYNELIPRDWHFDIKGHDKFHLAYPDGAVLEMVLFGQPQKLVIWTNPAEGNFICVEPVLRGRNSMNTGNAVQVPPDGRTTVGYKLKWV